MPRVGVALVSAAPLVAIPVPVALAVPAAMAPWLAAAMAGRIVAVRGTGRMTAAARVERRELRVAVRGGARMRP